jgi:hypothetical protein
MSDSVQTAMNAQCPLFPSSSPFMQRQTVIAEVAERDYPTRQQHRSLARAAGQPPGEARAADDRKAVCSQTSSASCEFSMLQHSLLRNTENNVELLV